MLDAQNNNKMPLETSEFNTDFDDITNNYTNQSQNNNAINDQSLSPTIFGDDSLGGNDDSLNSESSSSSSPVDTAINTGSSSNITTTNNKNSYLSLDSASAIRNSWIENWSEPLPTNKEDRIQQALKLMKTEEDAFNMGKNVKKHSIRQIALFFKIPKSTLYDRLKNRTPTTINNSLNMHSNTNTNKSKSIEKKNELKNINKNPLSSHRLQMKLSPEKEQELLTKLKTLCHLTGNILTPGQIKKFITTCLDDDTTLGKKWVHNFLRRHDNDIIYGSSQILPNVQISNARNSRNHFSYLRKCFIQLFEEKLKILPNDTTFYYIVRSCLDQKNMSSIFTCFEISITEMKITTKFKPIIVLFPRFIEKTKNKSSTTTTTNNNQNLSFIFPNSNSSTGKMSDINPSNSIEDNLSFANVNQQDSNFNTISKPSIDNISEKNKQPNYNKSTVKDDKIHKQAKIEKLNSIFIRFYSECLSLNKSEKKSKNPFIIFEGLTDRYNWDFEFLSQRISDKDNFLTVPWNESIIQNNILHQLRTIVSDITTDLISMKTNQLSSLELDIDPSNLNTDIIRSSFFEIFHTASNQSLKQKNLNNIQDQEILSRQKQKNVSTIQNTKNNSYNDDKSPPSSNKSLLSTIPSDVNLNFYGNFNSLPPTGSNSPKQSLNNENSNISKSTPDFISPNNILQNENADKYNGSTMTQLQSVIKMVEENEKHIYDGMSTDSKTCLKEIFKQIKDIAPH